jgi:FKBP-type peptidyl-prolyl cis-trans isomerase SlyD
MEIRKNSMVTLRYDLRVDDEEMELVEKVTAEKPLQFLFGAGMMLPGFETQLTGLSQGDSFEIRLNHKDAYGEVNDEAVVDLPKHIFQVDGKFDEDYIKTGNTIPMMSGNGQRLNGLVLEVEENSVRMDFNHPLAGEDLYFMGEILEVRQATDDEIVKTMSGSCGCDSSSCNSGGCQGDSMDGCNSGCCC